MRGDVPCASSDDVDPPLRPVKYETLGIDVEGLLHARGTDAVITPPARDMLRADASSLSHLLRRQPRHPCCESCRRAHMKAKRKYVGVFKNTVTCLGSARNWGPNRYDC